MSLEEMMSSVAKDAHCLDVSEEDEVDGMEEGVRQRRFRYFPFIRPSTKSAR